MAFHEIAFETITIDRQGQIIERERLRAQQFVEDLGNGVILEMIAIPGGAFLMGSPQGQGYDDERPQHRVKVAPFLMGKHPITQAQWASVMGQHTGRFSGDLLPVENISWDAAQAFCRRLSSMTGRPYRLPCEAEWEYACRAGTTTPFACGWTLTTELANYNGLFTFAAGPKGVYRHAPTAAGSFPPNAFGLHDMHGNLWEWCADPWHESYEGAPVDGQVWTAGGPPSLRVLRGGSWHDTPDVCRSAVRLKLPKAEGDEICGFRVAMSLRDERMPG
jgi:formylglycine-generating enzyme required for sulfatase activity